MEVDLEKIENAKGYLYVNDKRCPEPICVEDYIAYKEIEEKLGINLITLFKTLEQGYAWIKTKQGIQKATIGAFSLKNLKVVLSYDMCEGGWRFHRNMHLTDYGKTWSLTKEELL